MMFIKKTGTLFLTTLMVLGFFTPAFSQTEVYIEIAKTPGEKIEIAIPDFEPSLKEGEEAPEDLSKTIAETWPKINMSTMSSSLNLSFRLLSN